MSKSVRILKNVLTAGCVAVGALSAIGFAAIAFLTCIAPHPPGEGSTEGARDAGIMFLACFAFMILPVLKIVPAAGRIVLAAALMLWVLCTRFMSDYLPGSQPVQMLFAAGTGVLMLAVWLDAPQRPALRRLRFVVPAIPIVLALLAWQTMLVFGWRPAERMLVPPTQILQQTAVAPEGGLRAVSTTDGAVEFRRIGTGEVVSRFVPHYSLRWDKPFRPDCMAFSPDGTLFATWFSDEIKLWRRPSLELVRTLRSSAAPGRALAFSPDSKTLVAVGTTIFADGREQSCTYAVDPDRRPFAVLAASAAGIIALMVASVARRSSAPILDIGPKNP